MCVALLSPLTVRGDIKRRVPRKNRTIKIGANLTPVIWLFRLVPTVYHGEHGWCQTTFFDIWKAQRQGAQRRKIAAQKAKLAKERPLPEPRDTEFEEHIQLIRKERVVQYHKVDQTSTASRLDDRGQILGWKCPQILNEENAIASGWPHSQSYSSTFFIQEMVN